MVAVMDGYWRIEMPLDPASRALFEEIDRYGQDYVNALDVVKDRMKNRVLPLYRQAGTDS